MSGGTLHTDTSGLGTKSPEKKKSEGHFTNALESFPVRRRLLNSRVISNTHILKEQDSYANSTASGTQISYV